MALVTTVVGQALETLGFQGNNTISGLGLNSFGFVWGAGEIWSPAQVQGLTTTWVTAQAVVSTTWVTSEATVTTTWVPTPDESITII